MFNIFRSAPKNYENLDEKAFKTKYQNALKAALLDVRTAGEFASGTIKGARNLDVTTGQFQNELGSIDKTRNTSCSAAAATAAVRPANF